MFQVFRNAFALPDLRKRILFTLGVLVLYQLAAHVPVPGVNQAALNSLFSTSSGVGALANVINLLSGGAVSNFSVLAMGVYPYITAQIIIQLLGGVIPALERMMKEEGSAGRKKMESGNHLQSHGADEDGHDDREDANPEATPVLHVGDLVKWRATKTRVTPTV